MLINKMLFVQLCVYKTNTFIYTYGIKTIGCHKRISIYITLKYVKFLFKKKLFKTKHILG